MTDRKCKKCLNTFPLNDHHFERIGDYFRYVCRSCHCETRRKTSAKEWNQMKQVIKPSRADVFVALPYFNDDLQFPTWLLPGLHVGNSSIFGMTALARPEVEANYHRPTGAEATEHYQ